MQIGTSAVTSGWWRGLPAPPPIAIGNTPSWRLRVSMSGLTHEIILKDESANPFGSIKDRVAWGMIAAALSLGRAGRGSHIVEASSGNTGLAVAALGNLLDLEVTIVAGSSITPEHRALIEAAGASLILTGDGHSDRIREAARIAAERGAFFLNQYENPANPLTHRDWSAPEVFAQYPDCDAVFVCASSGGTASGFAMHAAQAVSRAALVVVDPRSSHVVVPGEDTPSPVHISGFGSEARSSFASFFAGAEMVRTSEREAFAMQRAMAGALGIDLGFSSGGIVAGAFSWLGRRSEPQQVVCVCPDSGQRYASAPPFATEALARWFPDLTAAIAAEANALHRTIASVERIPFKSAGDAERVATFVRA